MDQTQDQTHRKMLPESGWRLDASRDQPTWIECAIGLRPARRGAGMAQHLDTDRRQFSLAEFGQLLASNSRRRRSNSC